MIYEIIIYVLKVTYLMLPGIFGNMAPIIVKGKFKQLEVPVDRNRKLKRHYIFGKSKTYRGIVFAILFTIIVSFIQKMIHNQGYLRDYVLIDYGSINIFLFGLLMGSGVILGDLIKSFFKRRIGIKPSKPFIPWDQTDSAIGAITIFSIVYYFDGILVISVIVLSFILHIAVRMLAYTLRITKEKF